MQDPPAGADSCRKRNEPYETLSMVLAGSARRGHHHFPLFLFYIRKPDIDNPQTLHPFIDHAKSHKCLISVFQFAYLFIFLSAIPVKAKHATGFSTPDNSPKFLKRNTKRTVRCHSPVVTRTKRFRGNVFLFSSSSSSELELRGEPHVHARTCIY